MPINRVRKLFAIAAVAVVLCVAAAGASFYAMAGSECENDPVAEVPSPGGDLKAVVFQRGCGATTGFSTQVSVLQRSATLPNEEGNVFVADDNHGQAPSSPKGGPEVIVAWSESNRLLVKHHPATRVFKAATSFGGVNVRYEHFHGSDG